MLESLSAPHLCQHLAPSVRLAILGQVQCYFFVFLKTDDFEWVFMCLLLLWWSIYLPLLQVPCALFTSWLLNPAYLLKHLRTSALAPPLLWFNCYRLEPLSLVLIKTKHSRDSLCSQVWKPYCCGPVVLNFRRYQNHLEGLLKNTDCWDPPSEFLIWWVWVGAWEFVFPTSFQMMWCCWSWDHRLRITALAKRNNQLLNRHQFFSSSPSWIFSSFCWGPI